MTRQPYNALWKVLNPKKDFELELRILKWQTKPEDVRVELYEREPMNSQQARPEDSLATLNGTINAGSQNPRYTRDSGDMWCIIHSYEDDDEITGDVFRVKFEKEANFVQIPILKKGDEPHQIVYDIGVRFFAGDDQRFPSSKNIHATSPVKKKAPVLICTRPDGTVRELASFVGYIDDFDGSGFQEIEAQLSSKGELVFYDGIGKKRVTSEFAASFYSLWTNPLPSTGPQAIPDANLHGFQNFSINEGEPTAKPCKSSKRYKIVLADSQQAQPMSTVDTNAEALVEPTASAQDAARWKPSGDLNNPASNPPLMQIDEPAALSILHNGHTLLFRPKDGYQGSNKCNLFGLDIAWRSGLKTPVFWKDPLPNRHPGHPCSLHPHKILSYPTAQMLTKLAEVAKIRNNQRGELLDVDGNKFGSLVSDWESEADSLEWDVNRKISQGEVMLLVARHRDNNHSGHVGIIRRVHRVLMGDSDTQTGQSGVIGVDYAGWEATGTGAKRVHRRWLCLHDLNGQQVAVPNVVTPYWTTNHVPNVSDWDKQGGSDLHNGPFKDLHIIQLEASTQPNEAVLVNAYNPA